VPLAWGRAYAEDIQHLFSMVPLELPGIGLATPAFAVRYAIVGACALIRGKDAV